MELNNGYLAASEPALIKAAPRVIEALISSATDLNAAVADLVDNSIDARATEIDISLHTGHSAAADGQSRVALSVWDNGIGMTPEQIESAIVLSDGDGAASAKLGKYGVGLKAASFGKSKVTTIFSKSLSHAVCGIELSGGENRRAYRVLTETEPGSGFSRSFSPVPNTGTIVRWEDLRGLERFADKSEQVQWVSHCLKNLVKHLGVVFCRFLEDESRPLKIKVREIDANGGTGAPLKVVPIRPIPDTANPHDVYELTANCGNVEIDMRFYVAPKGVKNDQLEDVAGSKNGSGVYVFRNNRAIKIGGWAGLVQEGSKKLQLARVEIDIPLQLEEAGLFEVKHDKSGCQFDRTLRDSILSAVEKESGRKFDSFLKIADSRQRERLEAEVLAPEMPIVKTQLVQGFESAIRDFCRISGTPFAVSFKPFAANSYDVFNLDVVGKHLTVSDEFRSHSVEVLSFAIPSLVLALRKYMLKTSLSAQDRQDLETWNLVLRKCISDTGER